MGRAEATVEELVGMIQRGVLGLPEMQRQYVWRSTRVRDLMDSLYRGYPSGAILVWETDEDVPLHEFAVQSSQSPYVTKQLLLDGQQRLTSLFAVLRGTPVTVRGRKKPIELLFNLEHPDDLAVVTEVDENGEDEDLVADEVDSGEDELQQRFNRMAFVVATKKLSQLPHWVKVWTCSSERCPTMKSRRSLFGSTLWERAFLEERRNLVAEAQSLSARATVRWVSRPRCSRSRQGRGFCALVLSGLWSCPGEDRAADPVLPLLHRG